MNESRAAWVLGLMLAVALEEVLTRGAIVRTLWRELMRLFIFAELGSYNLVRMVIRPKYVLTGQCQKRGTCCTSIIGDPPRWLKKSERLLNGFIAYHQVMHNFRPVARGDNGEVIFSCNYLQTDGRCGNYRYRPLLCRNYPLIPFFEPPRPIPGCGYSVTPKVLASKKPRESLRIVNPQVIVHHPTRDGGRHRFEHPDDYELIDPSAAEASDL